ncbi:4-hydroxy-tetrahydrodipicolinate reductase [Oceanibacterium hippocampi]|uniref:4-hydroxy-tetrahydrodipicolinate reductase n=1 Tax=Oceanibacterium hippocampi TaxID=745714 RepID=A0A1Y5RI97_9PROT|nr:4-hydroxy-tetrahydrodipicolinate reductase [Oceanibacterium hippocampi]SLN18175.1 4-hydroxy-tetrahydrodipicolinate reductase [Oceanibacterium hippocampi]
MTAVRIGIVGAAGRMGRTLLRLVDESDGTLIAGATESPGHPDLGRDIGLLFGAETTGMTLADDPEALFRNADVVIDFTRPAASVAHAALAARLGTGLVIGTTGMAADDEEAVAKAAGRAPIVMAGNMSLGVNLLTVLTELVARALDDAFDIEIVEMHHRHKVDAPSGTALMLGRAAAHGRGINHDAAVDRGRDGITGARERGHIGYAALRGGNVVGEHSVIFAADDERIELTHKAGDRQLFARGAVKAAVWVSGRTPGLYSMRDVLGLG